jgi:hypothetical protein
MRLIRALVIVALVWAIAGCGTVVSGSGGRGTGSGLVLADEAGSGSFLLNVAGGAPELVEMSGTAPVASSDPELIDALTGAVYSLGVSRGALTLTPVAGAVGVAQIEFVDAVTAKPYALAVVRGGLTLIPG